MKTSFYLKFIVLLCLFQIHINPLFAKVIESDWYNYKINLPDACSVSYEGKDNNIVKILSPDNKTTFYIIGIESSRSDKVFKNSFMDEVDALYFKQLNRRPNKVEESFFLSKQDHFYNLENSDICHSQIRLMNDKALLLVGFNSSNSTEFIDYCIKNIHSETALGKIATLLVYVLCILLIFIIKYIWDKVGMLWAIFAAIITIAGLYYFHHILDYSNNRIIESYFEAAFG